MPSKKLIATALMLIALAGTANAAEHFVDNTATGNNDGSSWTNAWQSFSEIEWNTVQPGDTIYISGGTSEKTYNEQLRIGTSGLQGQPITIKPGAAHPSLSSGHDGMVMINSPSFAIDFKKNDSDYVTINGKDDVKGVPSSPYENIDYIKIQITNTSGASIISGWTNDPARSGIKILYIHINGGGGIYYPKVKGGSEIAYCDIENDADKSIRASSGENSFGELSIHHNWVHELRGDGIKPGSGVDVYNNIIGPYIDEEFESTTHADLVQTIGGYLRIYNNLFYPGGNPPDHTNGMLFLNPYGDGQSPGHMLVYNNVFTMGGETYDIGGKFYGILLDNQKNDADTDHVKIFHNTLVDVGFTAIGIRAREDPTAQFTNIEVKNNLVYNSRSSGSPIWVEQLDYDNSDIDIEGNLVHKGDIGGNTISWDGTSYTVEEFNSTFNKNNIHAEPSFVTYSPGAGLSNDLHLAEASAGIDAGADLSAFPYLSLDKDGNTRPQGTAYDIGAYEFSGQECVTMQALLAYIQEWKEGNISIQALMEKIALWKQGC